MVFRWRANDGPILNAGLVALRFFRDPDQYCLKKLYFCDFFRGGGANPLFPPLDLRMSVDWDLKHQLTRTDTKEHDHEIPQSQTLVYLCRLLHQENNTFNKSEKCSGKLVEHLNWDRSAASSKLTGDTVLCP